MAGGGGPPRLALAPTAEPAHRQPPQRLPNAIRPGVLRTVLVLASASCPLRVRSDASHTARGADPHNLSAYGLGEEREQEVGWEAASADGSCKARSSLVPPGAPEFGSTYTRQREASSPPLLLSGPLTLPPTFGDSVVSPLPSPWGEEAEAGRAPHPGARGSAGPRSRSGPSSLDPLAAAPLSFSLSCC